MIQKVVLVHGYWISRGASFISEKQADAAARAYLKGDVNLILIPAGKGEWGQNSIGEFIRNRILGKYQEISPDRVIALNDNNAINTKKEIKIGLNYLSRLGASKIMDLAAPFHTQRVKKIVDDFNSPFDIEYKTTSDYLNEEENREFFESRIYSAYECSEQLRLKIFKNSILNFLSDLVPNRLKRIIEFIAAKIA